MPTMVPRGQFPLTRVSEEGANHIAISNFRGGLGIGEYLFARICFIGLGMLTIRFVDLFDSCSRPLSV